jgi:hypothetical protein
VDANVIMLDLRGSLWSGTRRRRVLLFLPPSHPYGKRLVILKVKVKVKSIPYEYAAASLQMMRLHVRLHLVAAFSSFPIDYAPRLELS